MRFQGKFEIYGIEGKHFFCEKNTIFFRRYVIQYFLSFYSYNTMMIIKIDDFGTLPIPALEIQSQVNCICRATSRKLINEWLADVAEIFLENKNAWSNYFEKSSSASLKIIEKYFRTINALLSKQLRSMVIKTLRHLRDFFVKYNNGNTFNGDYQDLMFTRYVFYLSLNTF